MKRYAVLLLLILIMLAIRIWFPAYPFAFLEAETTFAFGFLLLTAYLLSDVFVLIRLPRITGYLAAGVLFGPYLFDFIRLQSVTDLRVIDDLVLNFIALAAGGELVISELSSQKRSIFFLITLTSLIIFAGVTIGLFVLKISIFDLPNLTERFVMCALVGVIAIARSPSSAMAVISETKARGRFTDTVLGVTVVTDIMIIILFALTASAGKLILTGLESLNIIYLASLFGAILISILAGIFIGWFISVYFRYIATERVFFIWSLVFIVAKISAWSTHILHRHLGIDFHLEPMIICLVAGFVVRNFFAIGPGFIHALERSSLPLYVLFFSVTGAALNINVLKSTWQAALLVVVLRFIFMWAGSYVSGRMAGDPALFNRNYGLNFMTQAGVSFGLVKLLQSQFPAWGEVLGMVLIASIIINQIAGPVLMKISLDAVGETAASRNRRSER